ncbi:hypothetical protein T459_03032 [Capsicum annuum]|uniref:Major facilitator superfamily domain-containing protein 12-like n=1 Tax=Capsicum annuum TaxID=4072 RepID=A0A2G3ALR5_CAPAN|nr:hypothetical protein T459_03032 [Capsicum annuum]
MEKMEKMELWVHVVTIVKLLRFSGDVVTLLYLPADSPDAQIFYNGSSSIAGSPLANSPIPSGTLQGKSIELVKTLRKRRINIACVQETKWVGSKARDVDGYKLWYSGSERRRNGVGILVDEELRGQVVEVKRINDRLMTIKLVIRGFTLNVCSAYAPQVGSEGEEKMRFWEALEEVEFACSIMTGSIVENDEAKPLGRWSVLVYGVGHVLNDITSTYWNTYLLLYLTSIGVPPKQVAALAITGQFTDAIMTIIAGELIDRFGHFKIWHAVGTVLVSVAFSSFYWGVCVPCKIIGIDTPLMQMFGYYMFDILFSGGWSCTQVSHMAMVNGITLDQTSRVACVSCRNAFTMVASLIVYGVGFFIFNSSVKQVEIKEQYHLLAFITILIGCCFVIIFHLGTKEPRVKQVSHKTNPRGSSWKRWLKNGLYYRVACIYMLTRVVTNISQVFLALYVISDLHMSQSSKALVPAIIYLCSFVTSVVLQELEWSSNRLKAIFSVGGLLWLFSGAVVLSLPINMNSLMYILSVVIGIANAFMMVTSVGMESELVDKEVEGSAFVYGSLGFVEKVLCGIMLYILESKETVTPASCNPAYPCFTVTRFSLGFIPGVAALAGVIVTCFTKFRTSHPEPLAEPLLA